MVNEYRLTFYCALRTSEEIYIGAVEEEKGDVRLHLQERQVLATTTVAFDFSATTL